MAATGGIEVHVVDDAQSQESITVTVISDTDDDADGDVWADVAAPAPEPRRRNKGKRRLADSEDASRRPRDWALTAGTHRARYGHLTQPLDTLPADQRRAPRRLGPRTVSVELIEASQSNRAVPPKGEPGKRRRTQRPSAAADASSMDMDAVGFGVGRGATTNGHSRDPMASSLMQPEQAAVGRILGIFGDADRQHVIALLRQAGNDEARVTNTMLVDGFPRATGPAATSGSNFSRVSASGAGGGNGSHDRVPSAASATSAASGIECGCCYDDEKPFSDLVQCAGGHLFCTDCVCRQVKEASFGVGRSAMPCMDTSGCTEVFPISELRRSLPPDVYDQLITRQQDEAVKSLTLAGAGGAGGHDGLHSCPKPDCGFAMMFDASVNKVFSCRKCGCETCVHCEKDWTDHFGLKCTEVEDSSATAARRKVEEGMTAAMMRVCWSCKVAFEKESGCNKMTCRCGATMCYICRSPITIGKKKKGAGHGAAQSGYEHFCNHPRDPGQSCKKCRNCSLWTSPAEDDVARVAEARAKALAEVGDQLADGVTVAS